jgi:hypothetical protein
MLVDTTNMTEGQKAWVECHQQRDAWSRMIHT